jgi:hypothetical protein
MVFALTQIVESSVRDDIALVQQNEKIGEQLCNANVVSAWGRVAARANSARIEGAFHRAPAARMRLSIASRYCFNSVSILVPLVPSTELAVPSRDREKPGVGYSARQHPAAPRGTL